MTTIKDIANQAGVSIATVSHVINGTRFVSKETSERVAAAMRQLDYQPNIIAKSLKTSRSHIVAFIIPDIANPYFSEVCRGFQDMAAQNDFIVVVFNTDRELAREKQILEVVRQYRVNGVVLNPAHIALDDLLEVSKNGVEVVLLGNQVETERFDMVMVDNVKASLDAVSRLIEMGHRRLALVNGAPGSSSGARRQQGFLDALELHGIPVQKEWLSSGSFTFESGYQQAARLLRMKEPPGAIFAANDMLALGVLSAANDMEVRVPEQLSIMGFDNIPETERSRPRLSTVDQPKYETGQEAGRLLFEALRMREAHVPQRVVLKHRLVMRESTRQVG